MACYNHGLRYFGHGSLWRVRSSYEDILVPHEQNDYFKLLIHEFMAHSTEQKQRKLFIMKVGNDRRCRYLGGNYMDIHMYPDLMRYVISHCGSNIIEFEYAVMKYLKNNDDYMVNKVNAYLWVIMSIYNEVYDG